MNKNILTLVWGCMFSGKTDFLIQKIEQQPINSFLIFKPKKYSRDTNNFIFSRKNVSKKIPAICIKKQEEILFYLDQNPNIKTVFIDEVHFFDLNFIDLIEKLLKNEYNIFLAGLDKGVCEHTLKVMEKLAKISNVIHKMYALCVKCNKKASKTQLIDEYGNHIDPNFLISRNEKLKNFVGGKEKYQARCQDCYFPYFWKKDNNE